MVITPEKYTQLPTYDLLDAIARGRIGFDHRVLRVLLDRGDEAARDIARWYEESGKNDTAYEYDLGEELLAVCRHLRMPAAIPFFIEYIRREPNDASDTLSDALHPVRQAALEPLLKLYEELEEDEAGEVAFQLAGFGIRDQRVLQILLDRLDYDAIDGAICLGLYGDPAARPALEKMLTEVPEAEVHVRRNLEQALSELRDEPVHEEPGPWDIWEDFPKKALPEFEDLPESERLEYLSSNDPEYRAGAASSFISSAVSDSVVDALLERAQSDEDAAVRGKCWEALSDQTEKKGIQAAMLARLQDASVSLEERAGALVGLAAQAGEAPVRQFAEELYQNDTTRAAALKAMWNSMDRSFGPNFPKHLDDPDPDVKKQAIAGIGYLGVYEAAEKLRQFMDDDEFRANALFAYALSARHEVSRGRIRALLRKVEDAAGGLGEEEEELVKLALDERLLLHGHQPVFYPDRYDHEHEHEHKHDHEHPPASADPPTKVGRNDPCPCGSGKKYKKCCGG